jgi:Glycosyl hydrolase family 76
MRMISAGAGALRSLRRHPARTLIAVCTVAALAIAPTALIAGASAAPAATSPQKAGMAELMKYYTSKTKGLIGTSWWQGAVALSTEETYQQATGDKSYSYAIEAAFRQSLYRYRDFEDSYNDDTGWWGLAWLQAYTITHDKQYLTMAETDANYMHASWTSACGGGLWWKRYGDPGNFKNAIPNELFLELTAWLHNAIKGDKKYLQWANAEWSWFRTSGMINSQKLVDDGLSTCARDPGHAAIWTYNQGVILAGLSQLYRATRRATLLPQAVAIARSAISHLSSGGILTERCGNTCGKGGTDAESFKGVFIRDLKVLAVTTKTDQFNSFFEAQARSIEAHDTTTARKSGVRWQGPIQYLGPYSQASAEDALVAALH